MLFTVFKVVILKEVILEVIYEKAIFDFIEFEVKNVQINFIIQKLYK